MPFKIYSLLLVKNEADIIRASLMAAVKWSDKVIVMDNGSDDGTWEIVQELAAQDIRIVAFMQYTGGFHIGLRAKAFRAFRHELSSRDWWCVRLDADEFFSEDILAIESGITLADGYTTKPCKIERLSDKSGYISLIEGKYHEIKRLFGARKNKIVFLERVSFGDILLGDLPRGEWRFLSESEEKLFIENK